MHSVFIINITAKKEGQCVPCCRACPDPTGIEAWCSNSKSNASNLSVRACWTCVRLIEYTLYAVFQHLYVHAYVGMSVETVNLTNGGPRGELTISQIRCYYGLLFTGETCVVHLTAQLFFGDHDWVSSLDLYPRIVIAISIGGAISLDCCREDFSCNHLTIAHCVGVYTKNGKHQKMVKWMTSDYPWLSFPALICAHVSRSISEYPWKQWILEMVDHEVKSQFSTFAVSMDCFSPAKLMLFNRSAVL